MAKWHLPPISWHKWHKSAHSRSFFPRSLDRMSRNFELYQINKTGKVKTGTQLGYCQKWWNQIYPEVRWWDGPPAFTIRPIDWFPKTGIITPWRKQVEWMDRRIFSFSLSVRVGRPSLVQGDASWIRFSFWNQRQGGCFRESLLCKVLRTLRARES